MAFELDRSQILNVLRGFNPWWAGLPMSVPTFRRLAFDQCVRLLEDPKFKRAILLSGPRRVGKTTVLKQVAELLLAGGAEPVSVVYISLDHPLLKLASLTDLLRIYREDIFAEGKPAVLLLDEVQYAEDWELHVKTLVDHHPEYRILATGSAAVATKRKQAESGVGRWITVPIPTLSFYEYLRIREVGIPKLLDELKLQDLFTSAPSVFGGISQAARPLLPEFRRYLLVGGFPETAQQASVEIAQQILREDVVERVLRKDLVALYAVRSVREFEQLFIYLCLHTGGIFAVKTVATALGVAAPTVENHLEVLEQAHLIYRLPPIAISGKKILKAKDKIYIADAALRNAVLLKGDQILDDPAEMGLVAETTVLRHVFAFYYQDTPRVSYWLAPAASGGKRGRPKAGEERGDEKLLEVDIVVQSPSYTIPFEVKYRDTATLHATSGLVAFCREEKVERAYFVTKRNEDFGVSTFPDHRTKYLRIPAHILTCLLGRAERIQWRGKVG